MKWRLQIADQQTWVEWKEGSTREGKKECRRRARSMESKGSKSDGQWCFETKEAQRLAPPKALYIGPTDRVAVTQC